MIATLDDALKQCGMRMNLAKSEVVVFNPCELVVRDPLVVDGVTIREVQVVRYLGALFSSSSGVEEELEKRRNQAAKVWGRLYKPVFKPKSVPLSIKGAVYKTFVLPVLLYACETWACTSKQEEDMEKWQSSKLRVVLRKRLSDRTPLNVLRDRLGVQSVVSVVRKRRLQYFGKHMLSDKYEWVQRVMCGKVKGGKRSPGAQKVRWSDCVLRDARDRCNKLQPNVEITDSQSVVHVAIEDYKRS
jgi:hypothetical protein